MVGVANNQKGIFEMRKVVYLGVSFIAGVATVLAVQSLTDNRIHDAIAENSRIEDGVYKTLRQALEKAECHYSDIRSPTGSNLGSLAVMTCSLNATPLVDTKVISDEKAAQLIDRYFTYSNYKTPISYGINEGILTASYLKVVNDAFTYSVERHDDEWKITCIKPVSSGEVCPKF